MEVFPASRGQMEWMFRSPRMDSLILINGVLSRMEKKDVNAPVTGG